MPTRFPLFVSAALLSSAALLTACGGGGGGGSSSSLASGYPQAPLSCALNDQQSWLRDYMSDQYYWFDRQGTANAAAPDMAKYLDSLLYKPTDRYSYTQSTAQYTQFFTEGRRTGYGYSLAWADAAQTVLKVRFIEPQSPVAAAGLLRGETVVSIDGLTPAQITAGGLAAVSTVGVARNFVVKNAANVQRSFSVLSADFALTPVSLSTVLTAGNGAKVGYLAYQEFISSSNSALANAFDGFRTAGITELIVDLRYNGGGSVAVARNLASLIGGAGLDGKVFGDYRYNSKNSASNFAQRFSSNDAPTQPLASLARVFVLTSASTASASELLVNGLRPFKPVITIGATTFGKPYGFQPREACGTTYSAVNLEVFNANGIGGYSAGLPANCSMSDDLSRQLGDPAELRTAAALGYIQTGACPPVANSLEKNTGFAGGSIDKFATDSVARNSTEKELRNQLGWGETGPRQMRVD